MAERKRDKRLGNSREELAKILCKPSKRQYPKPQKYIYVARGDGGYYTKNKKMKKETRYLNREKITLFNSCLDHRNIFGIKLKKGEQKRVLILVDKADVVR